MSRTLELLEQLPRIDQNSVEFAATLVSLRKEINRLELRAAMAPQGTVKDVQVSPPGAAEASERAKQHEVNLISLKKGEYTPPWNPGKSKGEDLDRAAGFAQVLENKLIKPETRAWLENLAKER